MLKALIRKIKLKLTSGGQMKKYVFSIGLIPVQEFISEARRSRDLRWGSVFISKMAAMVLAELIDKLNANIIVPQEEKVTEIASKEITQLFEKAEYSLPNRATGFCKVNSEEELKKIFTSLDNIIEEEWIRLKTKYYSQSYLQTTTVEARGPLQKLVENVNALYSSVSCPLQLVWTVLPANTQGDEDERLRTDLTNIDQFYTDIKRTRPIKTWEFGAPVEKCTQCGKREAIGNNSSFGEWRKWYTEFREAEWVKKAFWFEQSERLCSVCTLKRIAGYDKDIKDSFPSTNEVSCRYWLGKIKEDSHWQNVLGHNYQNLAEVSYLFLDTCHKMLIFNE